MAKTRVLIVGGTGYIGKRLVKASLAEGHQTFILRRPEIGLDIDKLQVLMEFKRQGAELVEGSFSDHRSLVEAVKKVDVVICAISGVHFRSHNLLLQLKLVDAIKEAGNVKANATDELPERLIGAVRVSHIELSSAIVPVLESDSSDTLKT
ncbi:hypothetical protein ACP275_01G058500 [Erythranthe tilingii]